MERDSERERMGRSFFLTEEARAELRVCSHTIHRYIKAGKLPGSVKIGKSWRIPVDAVRALLTGGSPAGGAADEAAAG